MSVLERGVFTRHQQSTRQARLLEHTGWESRQGGFLQNLLVRLGDNHSGGFQKDGGLTFIPMDALTSVVSVVETWPGR